MIMLYWYMLAVQHYFDLYAMYVCGMYQNVLGSRTCQTMLTYWCDADIVMVKRKQYYGTVAVHNIQLYLSVNNIF
jgi:hypothetical protein